MKTTRRLNFAKTTLWGLTALWLCGGPSSNLLPHHLGSPAVGSMRDLIRLLPSDTLAVIGLPAAQPAADEPAGQIRSEILFAAGLKDKLQKIQPLLDAVAPRGRMLLAVLAEPEGSWVALVAVAVQEAGIRTAARQAGLDIRQEGGAFHLAASNGGSGSASLLIVPRPEFLLAGDAEAVRRSLNQQDLSAEALFAHKMQDIPPDVLIWGAALRRWLNEGQPDLPADDVPEGFLLKTLGGVEAVQFSARVGSAVDFRMRTQTASEKQARVLGDELSEFIAEAAPQGAADEVRQVMQSAKVEQKGRTIDLKMSITKEAMAHIRGNAASQAILRWRLGAADRERNQRVADLFAWLPTQAGMRVADIGAGRGFTTFRLARLAGPEGKVYAVEILPELVERLEERARRNAFSQIEPILGQEDDPRLPAGELDAALIVNSYHEMKHHQEMLRHILEALHPGGRLVLNEPYSPSRKDESRAQQAENHEIAPDLAQQDLVEAGFEIINRQDDFIARKHEDHEHREWLIVAAKPRTSDNRPEGFRTSPASTP